MRVIGLTGGIATGKSSVARILEELGAVVIDADLLAREIVRPGMPALEKIVAAFGRELLNADGTLNRKALGALIFADDKARRRLEAITHPAIGMLAEKQLTLLRQQGTPIVFYMAPLLIEAGISSRVDEIWVVSVDAETQLQRLMKRDGITREAALRKIACQMPLAEKVTYGTAVIDNRGTLADTAAQIREIWTRSIQMGRENDSGGR